MEERVRMWIRKLCEAAGMGEDFAVHFIDRLLDSPEIYKELFYYAEHLDFLCEYKIQGYSVVDIMVWQIDHFKAELDRGKYDMRNNPGKMVVMAFDTFLDMERRPEEYVRLLQSETGTDYPGKF